MFIQEALLSRHKPHSTSCSSVQSSNTRAVGESPQRRFLRCVTADCFPAVAAATALIYTARPAMTIMAVNAVLSWQPVQVVRHLLGPCVIFMSSPAASRAPLKEPYPPSCLVQGSIETQKHAEFVERMIERPVLVFHETDSKRPVTQLVWLALK
jgi:hypothetical protein